MSTLAKRLLRLLELRHGVPSEFAQPLTPLLETCARGARNAEQIESILGAVARAYRSEARPSERREEVEVLLRQLSSELGKIEESLKVLRVFLSRACQQVSESEPRTLH